jgi:hypothetical protein
MTVKNQITEQKLTPTSKYTESDLREMFPGRKKLLELTYELIEETHDRIAGDRFRPREGDRERLAYLRTLVQLVGVYNELLKGSNSPPLDGLNQATLSIRAEHDRKMSAMFDFDI